MSMILENRDGLYYCLTDVITVDHDPVRCNVPSIHRAVVDTPPMQRQNKEYCPVSYNCLTESKLWMLQLGSPGEDQLDLMPGNVTGIPPSFHYTRSGSLIGKKRLGSRSKQLLNQPSGLQTYVSNSIWTLDSCKPCLWTTNDGIRQWTGLFPCGMVTHCNYWLLMKPQDTYGSSSPKPRSLHLT
jgi:hypothetical protein